MDPLGPTQCRSCPNTETSSSTSPVRPIVQSTSGPIHPNGDVATQSSPISQPSTSTPTHQLVQNHLGDSGVHFLELTGEDLVNIEDSR